MEITSVRVKKIDAEGSLKGYATVTFENLFVVHNIKVIEGAKGMFIAMPSRKIKNGEYKDIAHPIDTDFRRELEKRVLTAFENSDDTDQAS